MFEMKPVLEFNNGTCHHTAFFDITHSLDQFNALPGAELCPYFFWDLLIIMLNDFISSLYDMFSGTVILLKLICSELRKITLKLENVFYSSASERINTLSII